jgi:magnesium transporter
MIVDCGIYDGGVRRAGTFTFEEAFEASKSPSTFVWLGLHDPKAEELEAVRRGFRLHELAIEDARHAHQRPKVDAFGETLVVVAKPARYVDREEVVALGEVLVVLGPSFALTVRHGEASPLGDVRARLEERPDLLRLGPAAVLWAVLDHIVDGYAPVTEGLEHDVDEVEADVFSDPPGNPAERIYFLKREVLEFLRGCQPLQGPLDDLARGRFEVVPGDLRSYFGDVADHLRRTVEQLQEHRDLLTSVLQANLAQVGIRQNEDMRKISAWAAIFAVPTMIAGIYGMNFEHMPELKAAWGYPFALGLMAVLCAALYTAFKRSDWL